MSSFGYLIKEGFKNIFHNRLMSLASIGVLISCLVLTGSAVMLTINVSNIVDSVGDTNVTKVFLDDDLTKLEAVYKGKELKDLENVTDVQFIDKDESIQAYREQLGEEVFANMTGDDNPLPYSYSVTMDDLSKYDETVAKIKAVEGVASVSSHREVAAKLTSLSSFITTMSLWIILALAVISLFIISNTIRMTMFSHRFEISIMKSVGAGIHRTAVRAVRRDHQFGTGDPRLPLHPIHRGHVADHRRFRRGRRAGRRVRQYGIHPPLPDPRGQRDLRLVNNEPSL